MFDGMDPYLILLIFAAVVLAVSAAGAFLPRIVKFNIRQVHLMVAVSAGIFLGILFFMLLPETFHEAHGREMSAVTWIIGGFLAVLFIDVLLKRMHMDVCPCEECHDNDHRHEITSFTAYAGLAIHAAVDGMVISIALIADPHIGAVAMVGIGMHKFADSFALSSTFMLTGMKKKKITVYLIIFVLITPVAAFLSMPVVNILEDIGDSIFIPLAIATGTFMYVGIYALLPEAFHERRDSMVSFALVIVGIVAIALTAYALLSCPLSAAVSPGSEGAGGGYYTRMRGQ
ncbi:MAG: ZIP family metal transporter, partial [Methanomassiliicoccaceae archaeon]|nr:ZIP family metal transporter [Methanomassiliicoccaceae archaeon]